MNHQSNLSLIEWRLLQALSQGHANKHIARELCRSEYTVRNQLSSLYRKIGARNRTQAAHWYLDGCFARET